jgi:hypothetical protein
MHLKRLVITTLAVSLLLGCQNREVKTSTETPAPTLSEQEQIATSTETSVTYPIGDGTFNGISIGSDIASLPTQVVEKGELETGDGTFTVYYILGKNGEKIGYFHPDPRNESAVGDIMVTTPEAATEKGIRIGHSFGEITEKIADFQVHGSEIESRTHLFYENLALRLDYPSTSYELDPGTIPPETKVTEIWIRRMQ